MATFSGKTRSVRLHPNTDAQLVAYANERGVEASVALRELVERGLRISGRGSGLSGADLARADAVRAAKTEVRQAIASALNELWGGAEADGDVTAHPRAVRRVVRGR